MDPAELATFRVALLLLVTRGPCNDFTAVQSMRRLLEPLAGSTHAEATRLKVRKLQELLEMWLSGRSWDPYGFKTRESRQLRVNALQLCARLGGLLATNPRRLIALPRDH